MKRFIEIITYFICVIFNILRVRTYIIYSNGDIKRTYLSIIPNTIYEKKDNKYYGIISVLSVTLNKTMVYYYIKVEELQNN